MRQATHDLPPKAFRVLLPMLSPRLSVIGIVSANTPSGGIKRSVSQASSFRKLTFPVQNSHHEMHGYVLRSVHEAMYGQAGPADVGHGVTSKRAKK